MRLVYDQTGVEVRQGDVVTLSDGDVAEVVSFPPPHKPASSGKVYLKDKGEFFVSVIKATWIEREDR